MNYGGQSAVRAGRELCDSFEERRSSSLGGKIVRRATLQAIVSPNILLSLLSLIALLRKEIERDRGKLVFFLASSSVSFLFALVLSSFVSISVLFCFLYDLLGVRNMVTDTLSFIWWFTGAAKAAAPILTAALAKTKQNTIVDLCAGGGG